TPLVPGKLPGDRDPHLAWRARRRADGDRGLTEAAHQPGHGAGDVAGVETGNRSLESSTRLLPRLLGLGPPDVGAGRSRTDPAEPPGPIPAQLADQPRPVLGAHVSARPLPR